MSETQKTETGTLAELTSEAEKLGMYPKFEAAAGYYTDDMPTLPDEVVAKLRTPVKDEIVTRRGHDGVIYAEWVHYQRVLDDAFGIGGWRLVPKTGVHVRTEGNTVTWSGALFVRIPGSPKFHFVKEAKGGCQLHQKMNPADAAEGAQSDCLTKCCKKLGIFSELYEKKWREDWETRNEKKPEPPKSEPAEARRAPAARGRERFSREAPATRAASGATAPAGDRAPAAADTGEAATDQDKEDIRVEVKRLGWKVPMSRLMIGRWYGPKVGAAANPLEVMSHRQARACVELMKAFGTNDFDAKLRELREKGDLG